MKKSLKLVIATIAIGSMFAFVGEKDRLHKRDFTVEIFEGTKPKGKADEISFKDGKVFPGDLVNEKLGVSWTRYELKKDSSYMEDDMEKEYIEVFADTKMERDEVFEFTCVVEDYGIEGKMRLYKGDKDKKNFTFSGKEKVKKGKK